jgi:hypothetical protein
MHSKFAKVRMRYLQFSIQQYLVRLAIRKPPYDRCICISLASSTYHGALRALLVYYRMICYRVACVANACTA